MKLIWIGGIVFGVIFGVLLLVWAIYPLEKMDLIWIGVGFGALLLLALAIYPPRIIDPTETGVFLLLGKIEKVEKKGLYFWFRRPFGEVIRFPATQMKLEYTVLKPITREGRYYPQYETVKKQYKKAIKDKDDEKCKEYETTLDKMKKGTLGKEGEYKYTDCESVEIDKVEVAVYLKYPTKKKDLEKTEEGDLEGDLEKTEEGDLEGDLEKTEEGDLEKTLEVLGRPKNERELTEHFGGFVIGCLRDVLGRVEWKVAVENREHIAKEMTERFKEKNSPFMTTGFQSENIYVTITGVDISQTLTRLLSLPQEEFLRARAAEKEADRRATETIGTVVQMLAKAKGKEPEEIQREIKENPELEKEFLAFSKDLVVRKLGIEGQSYLDVRVQGAEGIERIFLNALAVWKKMSMERPSGEPTAGESTAGEPPTPAAAKTTKPEEPKEDMKEQINKLVDKRRLTEKEWDEVLKLIEKLPEFEKREAVKQIVRLAKEGKIRVI